MIPVLVGLGALAGAPARYLTDRVVQQRHPAVFPWGTLTVNVAACLILGIVTAAAGRLHPGFTALAATGLCGTLSTYSTFSYETVRLAQDGERCRAAAYAALSVTAGLGAAALGWGLGSIR